MDTPLLQGSEGALRGFGGAPNSMSQNLGVVDRPLGEQEILALLEACY